MTETSGKTLRVQAHCPVEALSAGRITTGQIVDQMLKSVQKIGVPDMTNLSISTSLVSDGFDGALVRFTFEAPAIFDKPLEEVQKMARLQRPDGSEIRV